MIIYGQIIPIFLLAGCVVKLRDHVHSCVEELVEGIFPQNVPGKGFSENIEPPMVIKGFCDLDRAKDKLNIHRPSC
jgi:hypothetical protein